MQVIVTAQEMTQTPISPLLCGSFIELGYGSQAEGLWSEMLFNRSFEPFPPYNTGMHDWYGLLHNPREASQGYRTDWTGEDWYHSGYEHNAWFAVPDEDGFFPEKFHVDRFSTFLVTAPPGRRVQIASVSEPVLHGERALRLTNADAGRWGGVAQGGKWLRPGESYQFRGWVRSEGQAVSAEVRLYPEGRWDAPIAVVPLGDCGPEWQEKTARLQNSRYEGRAVFSFWIGPSGSVLLDDFSLMPASARHGWRADAVEAMQTVNPRVIRFPGGCFASFYDWRDGVGPFTDRKPRPSYFWGGQNSNDVGTHEFAALAHEAGAEMMLCINLFHPGKASYVEGFETPQFADPEAGVALACDWVAYCNRPAGTHPMADLRASHGRVEPFGVRFWEMDNEAARWFGPEDYAETCAAYSRAMKAVDPFLQIGMMVYDDTYRAALPRMLEIAGADIDFLADRGGDAAKMERVLQPLRVFNAAQGTNIRYADTEWLADDFRSDLFWSDPAVPRTYWFNKWRYALNLFPCVMAWQRRGGEVLFFNFNGLANTHGQSALETPREGAFLSAAGLALELLSRSPAAWPLALEGYAADDYADFQVQAAWDLPRERLVLYAFNAAADPQEAVFDLSRLGRDFNRLNISHLCGEGPCAMRSAQDKHSVRRTNWQQPAEDGAARLVLPVPAYSFTQVVLSHV